MSMEQRTARLTVLIDPGKKAVFEHLCTREDQTSSQVVRRLSGFGLGVCAHRARGSGHSWRQQHSARQLSV